MAWRPLRPPFPASAPFPGRSGTSQGGRTSAGPVAGERGRPWGRQAFRSQTRSPDCKQQPCRGQEESSALTRERGVTREQSGHPTLGPSGRYARAPRTLQPWVSGAGVTRQLSKAGYRTLCVEHITAFIKSTLYRWTEGSGKVATSGWQDYR